jgi:hypothetical protein
MSITAFLRAFPIEGGIAACALTTLFATGCGRKASPCEEDNGGCSADAVCSDGKNDEVTCTCDATRGYAGDGKTCALDPCLMNNGGCGEPSAALCTDVDGGAQCVCLAGAGSNGTQCVPVSLSVPATNGTLPLAFDATISGIGSVDVGAFQIATDVGTIDVEGTSIPAVAYDQIPFGSYTLYQTLAIDTDRWVIAWAYCNGGTLESVYVESTNGLAGASESATGTCTATTAAITDAAVQFPASDVPPFALVPGFTVQGADINYDGEHAGAMVLDGSTWDFYPFTTVDCSTGCGTPGWYELHSLLWDPSTERACFGIYYLILNDADQVRLDYVICLPDLSDPAGPGENFVATYTHP